MTDLDIGRVSVRCVGEIPGPASGPASRRARRMGARLSRIAAELLPPLLESRLSDLRTSSVVVDELHAPLDFDVSSHDDETIALMWSDRIVAALQSLVSYDLKPGPSPERRTDARVGASASQDAARLDLEAWLLQIARAEPGAVSGLARSRPDVAAMIYTAVDAVAKAALIESTSPRTDSEAQARDGTFPPREARSVSKDERTEPIGRRASEPSLETFVAGLAALSSDRNAPASAGADWLLRRRVEELGTEVVRRVGELTIHGQPQAWPTATAGIVLLYPWFAEVFEAASNVDGGVVTQRRLALSVLCHGALDLVADPLVRLLAGDDLSVPPGLVAGAVPVEVAEAADAVVRRFGQLLPGFQESSSQFLRSEMVLREGELDMDDAAARLLVSSRGLDVLLNYLPYPLGLIQFPWMTPLSVEFER